VVALHTRKHEGARVIARGETWHLRCTRFFQDPETGTSRPGQEARVRRLAPDLERHRVTRRQILHHFDEIHSRSELRIYPGAGPRKVRIWSWRPCVTTQT
jgi:hypothetical protein